ncbi:MAG: IS200/IS605 family transposase [Planctomycetaceae bacterium]|nr:IS200/IS605 family transposase [Planctomycetaceae bacterium]
MSHTYSHLLANFVFSTKERRPWITQDIEMELHAYLGGIARNIEVTALAIGGVVDHVHLLVRHPRRISVSDLTRTLTSNSSGWIHEHWPIMLFQWQQGYAAFSVSESSRSKVMAYIQNQAEHHRTKTFQGELIELLERHGIEYDLRYLWD